MNGADFTPGSNGYWNMVNISISKAQPMEENLKEKIGLIGYIFEFYPVILLPWILYNVLR